MTVLRDIDYPTIERLASSYNPLHSFSLAKGDEKHYQQQYDDIYFLRLAMLKPAVEEIAAEAWGELEVQNIHIHDIQEVILRMLSVSDSRGKGSTRRSRP